MVSTAVALDGKIVVNVHQQDFTILLVQRCRTKSWFTQV